MASVRWQTGRVSGSENYDKFGTLIASTGHNGSSHRLVLPAWKWRSWI